jgi:predicted CXXCH cytochrome family protein
MIRHRVVIAIGALMLGAPLVSPTGGFGSAMAQTVHASTGCPSCHQLHGAAGANLTDYAVAEDLCIFCHGPAAGQGAPEDMVVHDGYRHTSSTTCVDCHTPHPADAGTNIRLIEQTVTTPNSGDKGVVFTTATGTNSFADGNTTLDGVCEVCHTDTDNHINSDPAAYAGAGRLHNPGTDCNTSGCHTHEGGFQPPACLTCHNTTQGGRRAVDGEFGMSSTHVSGVQVLDCRTCHELTQHQLGNVRFKNVDDPRDQSLVEELTGSPFTTQGEAEKLTYFCLACHDPAGNGPTQPFTGGATPPTIDSTAWHDASHFNDSDVKSCFGDGSNFGCHASGHGSQKQALLAPYTVAPTPPANAEEEEGFCFNCHSSSGSSTLDIEGQFDPNTIRWVSQSWGLNDHSDFNDRHDVQYDASSISGAKIECYDCHDPHAATTAQPFKSDPDPGDGHVPAANSRWTGQSLLSDFCLDCHDNSFPAGVSTHSDAALTDVLNTWLTIDRMGVVSSGGAEELRTQGVAWDENANDTTSTGLQLYTTGDILQCDVCHRPHPKRPSQYSATHGDTLRYDLFGMVDTVKTKNGMPLSWSLFSGGNPSSYTFDYGLTQDAQQPSDPWDAGGYFCNSCHDRANMNNRDTCGSSNCHSHGHSNTGL